MKRQTYYLKVFFSISKASFMSQLIYRTNALMILANMAIRILTILLIFQTAFAKAKVIGGWSKEEMFLFYGVFLLVDSIFDTFFSHSLQKIPTHIENGTLDMIIAKPANSIFLISFREFYYFNLFNIIFSASLIAFAWGHLNLSLSPINILAFILLIFFGVVIFYSINLILATISLHTIHTPFTELLESVGGIMKFPLNIFSTGIRFVFTFILPLIFVVTVPAEALLGNFSTLTFFAPLTAAIMIVLAIKFWDVSLKQYSSASS